ncbi:MAG: hypothetical protein MUE52_18950 [Tabrizicola sp.]|jgi:hypothetical protein|nr:hypothetical protein [Tabrizicola sp.]
MRRWLLVTEYHWAALLIILGLSAGAVAWLSFGLINLAMANYGFVSRHGWLALREGGLLQIVDIGARAVAVLAAYLLFKAVETELIHRWRLSGK